MINKKKKIILNTISFFSFIGFVPCSLGITYKPKLNIEENKLSNLKNEKKILDADTKYSYQDNYFLPMLSNDGTAISLDSTKKIISSSTSSGFLNWQKNIMDHPDLINNLGKTYKIANGLINGTDLNQEYIFLALEDGTAATNLTIKIIRYNSYGETLITTNNNIIFNNPTTNVEKKVAFTEGSFGYYYVYIPGKVSNFKTNIKVFNFSTNQIIFANLNINWNDLGYKNNKLNDNNYILSLVFPSQNSIGSATVYAIINNVVGDVDQSGFSGNISFAALNYKDLAFKSSFDGTLKTNTATLYENGNEFSIKIKEEDIYKKISPMTFSSASSNNNPYINFFINIPDPNNMKKIHAIKFFASDIQKELMQEDNAKKGTTIPYISEYDFERSIISPYKGNINLALFNNGTTKYIFKNNIDYWIKNTTDDQKRHLIFKQILSNEKLYKVNNAFIRSVDNKQVLSIYYENQVTSTKISDSLINIELESFPTSFTDGNNIVLQNSFIYFDDNYQKRAQDLKWTNSFPGTSILPSNVTKNITFGNTQENFFYNTNLSLAGINDPSLLIPTYYNTKANDAEGTFSSSVRVSYPTKYKTTGFLYYNVEIDSLSIKESSTSFLFNSESDVLKSLIATDVNNDNVGQFTYFNNLPNDAIVSYAFSNRNNLTGQLDIVATASKHYNSAGGLEETSKNFEIKANGLKIIKPTNVIFESDQLATDTTYDISNEKIKSWFKIENGMPSSILGDVYERTEDPLKGTINGKIKLTNYYDNAGNPVLNSEKIETFSITGLKKILPTTYKENPNANKELEVYNVTKESFNDYISIDNRVSNSTITFGNFIYDDGIAPNAGPNDGSVTFIFTVSKVYNSLGEIIDGTQQTMKVSGFKTGDDRLSTKLIKVKNGDNTIFPWQINSQNISNFINVENLPTGEIPKWTFVYRNINIDSIDNDGGSLIANIELSKYKDNTGKEINSTYLDQVVIRGFKSVKGPTEVVQSTNASENLYASDINEVNYIDYITIRNRTGIVVNETKITVESMNFNNSLGALYLNYKLENYFDFSGQFISTPLTNQELTLYNFKEIIGSTGLAIKDPKVIENILAEDFELNSSNVFDFFNLENIISSSTTIFDKNSIKILSKNNEKGEIKISFTLLGEYYGFDDKNRLIKINSSTEKVIEQVITGFKIVEVDKTQNNIAMFIGIGAGGFFLLILIISIIIIILRNKKKKEDEEIRKQKLNNKSKVSPTVNIGSHINSPTNKPGGPTPTRHMPPTLNARSTPLNSPPKPGGPSISNAKSVSSPLPPRPTPPSIKK